MANFLDKLKIKTAVDEHVKLDLSSQHISTANFMQFNVAWCKEIVPKEKVNVRMETFTRLEPLPVPTYGRGNINNRAFFVPFRTIFPAWNDFITDTRHNFNVAGSMAGVAKLVNTVPTVSNYNLLSLLVTNATLVTNNTFDFQTQEQKRYKLNAKGRQILKILNSLGYRVVYDSSYTYSYSALPLLALVKVYCDWYYPSAYEQDEAYSTVNGLFTYNTVSSINSAFSFDINSTSLTAIFNLLARGVNYDSDYFVSAWDNPLNPNDGAFSTNIQITPLSTDNTATVTSNSNEPSLASTGKISQYALTALRQLTDYMKRHQLVGARAMDRYLARFGINLPAEKLNRSVYIGSQKQGLQFGDVMSTADTATSQLGNYAGKGISYGDGNFEFDSDEYGIMIIVSSIVPNTGYWQGVDRNVLHKSKLDFFTPEFDNLGTQAITRQELYTPVNAYTMSGNVNELNTGVFGFTPRYAEYKIGKDRLTGDLSLNSFADSYSGAWHLMRNVEYSDYSSIVHDVDFVRGLDSDQYSRIFYNTDADVSDKFKVIYNFNVVSHSPMKSMFDTYDFESHGKAVTEDVNGVKMN